MELAGLQVESFVQAWDVVMGLSVPMVVKAACELGIPDMLLQVEGKPALSARCIAEKLVAPSPNESVTTHDHEQQLKARAEMVERMMRFLSLHGVFEAQVGNSTSAAATVYYKPTPLSAWLVRAGRGKPDSLQPLLLFETSQTILAPWPHLAERILAAGNADSMAPFDRVHATDLWGLTSADAPFSQLLNAAMSCSTHLSLQAFFRHYAGLQEQVHTLVDVGGGTGTAASYIAAHYPAIKVVNFDLPHVVGTAPIYPGVEHKAGDMFRTIPKGDVIFMKWILHDWSDEDCIKILKNCHESLPTNGKIIIMDAVMEDMGIEKSPFNKVPVTIDMLMMARTTSGKERSKKQWEGILHAANFSNIRFIELPCPQCVIEAVPCHNTL